MATDSITFFDHLNVGKVSGLIALISKTLEELLLMALRNQRFIYMTGLADGYSMLKKARESGWQRLAPL